MDSSVSNSDLAQQLQQLLVVLPNHPQGKLIQRALQVLIRVAEEDTERLNWKILTASLEDLEQGFKRFYPYRHTRKISIFGSARTAPQEPEYQIAFDFARCMTQAGFMVITGAGGGIMQAGNAGAGRDNSFGLNIKLPFEQGANSAINGDDKLINFKYFFRFFFIHSCENSKRKKCFFFFS